MWRDGAYKQVESIKAWLIENLSTDKYCHVSVGCDADKNRKKITYVTSIVLDTRENHGSIFIWKRELLEIRKITLHQKLLAEAERIISVFNEDNILDVIENFDVTCSAHIDINKNPRYKSNEMLAAIRGWIESVGVDVIAKPDSYAASAVADRFARNRKKPKRKKIND